MKFLSFIALTLAVVPAAFCQGNVDIQVPKNGKVTLEIDVQDEDILGLLKTFLGAMDSPASGAKVTASGSKDSFKIEASSLYDLVKDIHRIHVVTYQLSDETGDQSTDEGSEKTIAAHEANFKSLGLRRVIYSIGEDSSFLFMQGHGTAGMAFVLANDNGVTVIRTDGVMNYRFLGKAAVAFAPYLMKGKGLPSSITAMVPPEKPAKAAAPAKKPAKAKTVAAQKKGVPAVAKKSRT